MVYYLILGSPQEACPPYYLHSRPPGIHNPYDQVRNLSQNSSIKPTTGKRGKCAIISCEYHTIGLAGAFSICKNNHFKECISRFVQSKKTQTVAVTVEWKDIPAYLAIIPLIPLISNGLVTNTKFAPIEVIANRYRDSRRGEVAIIDILPILKLHLATSFILDTNADSEHGDLVADRSYLEDDRKPIHSILNHQNKEWISHITTGVVSSIPQSGDLWSLKFAFILVNQLIQINTSNPLVY
jgi:hypothetical protein